MTGHNLPKVAVIISNYNYAKYIKECVKSIQNQNYPYLQILIVDDGSSDNSLQTISSLTGVKVISKENGGQLSAFNAGFKALNKDIDIVFFLDADDVMNKNYMLQCVEFYTQHKDVEFAFCNNEHLLPDNSTYKPQSPYKKSILGFGLYKAYFLKEYLGNSTSSISIKKSILEKILPLDLEGDWRIRADDCIIWGASLVGANIGYLDIYGIKYRIHSTNNHYGKTFDNAYLFRRELNIEKMFALIMSKNNIILSATSLYLEFLSNKEKTKYIKITLLSNLHIIQKIKLIGRILLS